MYFLDTKTDNETLVTDNITLELLREAGSDTSEVRPIFDLASGLKTEWFKFSEDESWFVFVRGGDDFVALMEYDGEESDYTKATGTEEGKFLMSRGT